MPTKTARARITAEVMGWEGVEARPHRFGGLAFYLGRREIGHLHGDDWVDVPLTRAARDELVAAGEAQAHHVVPDSGWVTIALDDEQQLAKALEILRQAYEMRKNRGRRR